MKTEALSAERLLLGEDRRVGLWAGERLGVTFHSPYVAWGILGADGELAGALVFNEFVRGGNISLSLVGALSLRRDVLRHAARYVFRQLGCTRVTARTARSNERTREILSRSWQFECCQPQWFGPARGQDAFVYVLFPEAAEKWLR